VGLLNASDMGMIQVELDFTADYLQDPKESRVHLRGQGSHGSFISPATTISHNDSCSARKSVAVDDFANLFLVES
jgi:hypothetical protein